MLRAAITGCTVVAALLAGAPAVDALWDDTRDDHGGDEALSPADRQRADKELYRQAERHLLGAPDRSARLPKLDGRLPGRVPPPPGWDDQAAKLQVLADR